MQRYRRGHNGMDSKSIVWAITRGFKSHPLRQRRRRGLHIVRDDFFITQKSHQLAHSVAPPLPKKLMLFGGPEFLRTLYCLWRLSYSWIKQTPCYETVHCTVSPKFINEFGAMCLLCFAQFTHSAAPPLKICRTVVRQIL